MKKHPVLTTVIASGHDKIGALHEMVREIGYGDECDYVSMPVMGANPLSLAEVKSLVKSVEGSDTPYVVIVSSPESFAQNSQRLAKALEEHIGTTKKMVIMTEGSVPLPTAGMTVKLPQGSAADVYENLKSAMVDRQGKPHGFYTVTDGGRWEAVQETKQPLFSSLLAKYKSTEKTPSPLSERYPVKPAIQRSGAVNQGR